MTRVFEKSTNGPGTHAFIIGVGEYLGDNSPLQAAAESARQFTTWLIRHYRNPTAELATVELLISTREDTSTLLRSGGSPLDKPTLDNLRAAASRWRQAADANEDNLALFYFVGHGLSQASESVLLLDGFTKGDADLDVDREAIDFRSLTLAMHGCRARRQLFLVDAGRSPMSAPLKGSVLLPPPTLEAAQEPSFQTILYATRDGGHAYAEAGAETLFYKALIRGLSDARKTAEGAVTASALVQYVQRRLEELATQRRLPKVSPTATSSGDFNLHYPDLSPINEIIGGQWFVNDPSLESEAPPAVPEEGGASPDPAPTPHPAGTKAPRDRFDEESNTNFISDEAERERDDLGRAVLAIGLARRLHRIWRSNNDPALTADGKKAIGAPFVVHIDAPWGGGKTSFANYVAAVLNPFPRRKPAARFLQEKYKDQEVGGIFLKDPPPPPPAPGARPPTPPVPDPSAPPPLPVPDWARRPWIVVNFNAWEAEHCAPPWWLFSQTIRAQCFDAIGAEGCQPWDDRKWRSWRWITRKAHLTWLYICEFGWRLVNPKVRTAVGTAGVCILLLLVLRRFGVWGVDGEAGKEKVEFLLTNGAGLILAALTGISVIWGIGALFTESIAPGTSTLAERLSLGSGDPLARFRQHFHATLKRLGRPVMVIIDDLDRCKPEFVVDLIRGVQTLLRSPRVVFVILGDRNWIEQAFEQHHSAMKAASLEPEQAFGARFVEKAIQMSFVLPSVDKTSREAYLRHVLLGASGEAEAAKPVIDATLTAQIRNLTNQQNEALGPLAAEPIVEHAIAQLKLADPGKAAAIEIARPQIKAVVGETLAINAAVDERLERAATHQLQALAPSFPANPRQVKRIVNAITIYWAVALQRADLNANDALLRDLAIWMMIMHAWPKTWRSFVGTPELVDSVIKGSLDPELKTGKSGGYVAALTAEMARIRDDPRLISVLGGGEGSDAVALTSASAKILAELTPLDVRVSVVPVAEPAPAERAATA